MDAKTKENASVKDLMVFKARDEVQGWLTNFIAHMTLKGNDEALYEPFDKLLPENEMESGQSAVQKKNVGKNRNVMSWLAIVVKQVTAVVRLEKTKTESWPSGKA